MSIYNRLLKLNYKKEHKGNFVKKIYFFLLGFLLLVACQPQITNSNRQTLTPIPTEESAKNIPSATILPTVTVANTRLVSTPESNPESIIEITPTSDLSELIITSNFPDAQVYIDGNSVGFTPFHNLLLTGQSYSVTVTLPGFLPVEQIINLESGEPFELAVDFSFTPQIEELLDCVSAAWWAEEGGAIYFVKCPTFNGPQEGLWQLDLTTKVVTQIGETPIRPRIPAHLQPLIPESIRGVFVHLSPSSERIIYLEQLYPNDNQPTSTPTTDPNDVGELATRFRYLVYFIDQTGKVINLGQIEGTPFEITWSEDEKLAFMPTTLMDGDVPGAWLADLEKQSLQEMVPPKHDGSIGSLHFCSASLQPNGEAIMYRQCFAESTAPFLLWNYKTGDIQEIENYGPFYHWLTESRYILFSNNKALNWYDLETGESTTIMQDANAFFGPGQNIQHLSPQGDRIIFQRIRNSTPQGLWLLTFDMED